MKMRWFINLLAAFIFFQCVSLSYAMNNEDDEIPIVGWTCKQITDLGQGNSSYCQRCNTKIRYVHTMEHNNYNDEMAVGGICAENMDVNAKFRQENFIARKTSLKWKDLDPGSSIVAKRKNSYLIIVWKQKEGEHIGKYSYNVFGPSNLWFNTIEKAKQAAIDERWPLYLEEN